MKLAPFALVITAITIIFSLMVDKIVTRGQRKRYDEKEVEYDDVDKSFYSKN